LTPGIDSGRTFPYTGPMQEAAGCWSCRAQIDAADNYCRRCGAGQGKHAPWYYKHWGIILITLLGLGPFSLILVWRSPVMWKRTKWIYTVAIILGTWFMTWRVYQGWLVLKPMLDSLSAGPALSL